MNEHIPDSSGLPLRAMVMVLLFLGVIFLLVGFQAMGSSGDDDDAGTARTTISTTTSAPEKHHHHPVAEKPDVRVYNASDQEGVAGHTAEQLREAGWNVTEVDNLALEDVNATTVFFGEADGEHDAARAVGELLHASVEPRVPDLVEQPPGVIVVVAG